MNRINAKTMYDFLKKYEDEGETYLISDSENIKNKKLKKELMEIAKAKGIIVEGSKDLAIFKTVYTFADKTNGNDDMMQEEELLKALPTIVGKSINIDHISKYVVGHWIDYKYIQKTKTVIAYGIFFKSVFGEEYEEAKKMLEEGTLATSHEVWNDEDKIETLEDGTHILHDLEFAAGALVMYQDPAFEDTKVLALSTRAKKVIDNIKSNIDILQKQPKKYSLAYSSLTKEAQKNLITNKRKVLTVAGLEQLEAPSQRTDNEIICQKCSKNFTHQFIEGTISDIKCPSCHCILDKNGVVIYPSQKLNFDLTCEKCKSRNSWLIKKDNEKAVEIQCLSCQEEFKVSFTELTEKTKLIRKIRWLKGLKYQCLQCNKDLEWMGASTAEHISVHCSDCNLTQNIDLTKVSYKRKIKKIEKITSDKKEKSIKEIKMDKPITDKNIEINKIGGNKEMDKLAVAKLLRKAVSKINVLKNEKKELDKTLKVKELRKEKYLKGAKKFSTQIKKLRKEIKGSEAKNLATIQEAEDQKKFYMAEATELQKRKSSLGDFEHGYNDKELMDNLKYDLAISKRKIAKQDKIIADSKVTKPVLNTASKKIGDETIDEELREAAKGVNDCAFGKQK